MTSDYGNCTGGTKTTSGADTIHTFTSNGTLVMVAAGTLYSSTLTETVSLTSSLLKTASRLLSEVLSFIPNLSRGIVPNIASGPNYPTSAVDQGGGDAPWVNVPNVKAADGAYAVGTSHGAVNDTTGQLQTTGYNFSIPSGATVKGFIVEVSRSYTFVSGFNQGAYDLNLQMVKAGSPAGSNKATLTIYTTSQVTATYGSSTDLWGTTWAPSDVNASNFGFSYSAQSNDSGTQNINVDFIRITVYYSTGTTYSQTPTETVTTTATLVKATTRPIVEAISLADSFVRTTARSLAEAISLPATQLNATARNFAETIATTDTVAYLRTAFAILTETISTSDTIIRTGSRAFLETVSLVDQTVRTAARLLSETVSSIDNVVRDMTRPLSEAIALTASAIKSTGRSMTEAITLEDTFAYLKAAQVIFTEAFTITDAVIRTISRTLIQTFSVADTLSYARTTYAMLTEVLNLTAAFAYLRSVAATFDETISEAATVVRTAARTLSETIAATDTALRATGRTLLETVTTVPSLLAQTGRSLSEQIGLNDIVQRFTIRSLQETISITDSTLRTASRQLTETISGSDTLTIVRMYARSFVEGISLVATFLSHLPTRLRKGIAILLTRGDTEVLDTEQDHIVLKSKDDDPLIL